MTDIEKPLRKGLFPNISDRKTTLIAELIVGFIGLVAIYLIGMFWNWLFLKEDTSLFGWIIYFLGATYLFIKWIGKIVRWIKKLILLVRER